MRPVIASGGRLDVDTIEREVRDDLLQAVLAAAVRLLVLAAVIGGLAAAVLPPQGRPDTRWWRVGPRNDGGGVALGAPRLRRGTLRGAHL
ncbi:MAG: hypothetical protein R2789_00325 [Microthrixaceae bacterium]